MKLECVTVISFLFELKKRIIYVDPAFPLIVIPAVK
jgi:hypothetical protein